MSPYAKLGSFCVCSRTIDSQSNSPLCSFRPTDRLAGDLCAVFDHIVWPAMSLAARRSDRGGTDCSKESACEKESTVACAVVLACQRETKSEMGGWRSEVKTTISCLTNSSESVSFS